MGLGSCGKRGYKGETCTYLPGHNFDCYDANRGVAFKPINRKGSRRAGKRRGQK